MEKCFPLDFRADRKGTKYLFNYVMKFEEVKKSGKDIGVFSHPWRDNIYDEAEEVIRLGKDDQNAVERQMERYGANVKGLFACGVVVRHHTKEIKRLNEKWWIEYCIGSRRDQLSFPYVFKNYHILKGDIYNYKKWK
jgi:DNA polymerase III delta prime subunit